MAKRKLIEAAIPLDAINDACKADKNRKTGTIRNLHKWFAPMPPPAWRALLFATLVDDPEDEQKRDRLLRLIEDLVASGGDLPPTRVLEAAQREIARSWPDGVPMVVDPFCGGGSTLVEAQRFGCTTRGSDLNPVPVLITKTLTELLPRVAGLPARHPSSSSLEVGGGPYAGIEQDILYFANRVHKRARDRLAAAYPEPDDGTAVIAWVWCREVRCPNPACEVGTPLTTSWVISKRRGDRRWIEPQVREGRVVFELGGPSGDPPAPPKAGRGANFTCVVCGSLVPSGHIADEGRNGRLGQRCMAVVESTEKGERRYRAGTDADEALAAQAPDVESPPTIPLTNDPRSIWCVAYGIQTQADLYTRRQLLLLDTFAQEIASIGEDMRRDALEDDYVRAIVAVLGLSLGKLALANSTQVRWKIDSRSGVGKVEAGLGEHALPMTWDFAEANAVADVAGSWQQVVRTAIRALPYAPTGHGEALVADARTAVRDFDAQALIATDPPYFDQIGYADLSDVFYVWLRRALRTEFADLFATMAAPRESELVALPIRHNGGPDEARRYFIEGFTTVFHELAVAQTGSAPMLVVYAFKEQKSTAGEGAIAPGWEAILEAMMAADITVVGTWPIHGTGSTRMTSRGTNALATYVVLVCRPRATDAPRTTRSELARVLRRELGAAVAELQHANIAPVDLAQAVIGPGMQVYSRHSSVIDTDGKRVGVADALALINRMLAEILDEQEGDLDPDSRWAATWYDDYGFETAAFGKADQLARAKGIAVDSLVEAGIVTSGAGRVSLISRDALPEGWDPATDRRATAWEAVQYLVRALDEGGERAAAELYARLGGLADPARELAYRLFQMAEKKGRIDEAIAYNDLVTSWSEVARLAEDVPSQPTASTEALF